MLTARGWWILLTVLALLAVGLFTATPSLVLICLTLLSWLLGSWLIFAAKMRLIQGGLRVQRNLRNERGPLRILWTGQRGQVVARLVNDSWCRCRACGSPIGCRPWAGSRRNQQDPGKRLAGRQPLELAYEVTCPGAGPSAL